MQIIYTKISHQEYRLICSHHWEILFEKSLEMKWFFRHDIMHFVVESTAWLKNSFYGSIASKNMLRQQEWFAYDLNMEMSQTERVVAILQGMDKNPDISDQDYCDMINNGFLSSDIQPPTYISLEFIEACRKKYHTLLKQRNSLPTWIWNTNSLICEFR